MRELKRFDDTARDPVTDEAAAWLLRLRGAPDDAGLRAEFDAWLSRDPSHAEAWERAQQVWALSGILGPARRQSDVPASASKDRPCGASPHVGQKRTAARTWGLGLAAAASLGLGLVLLALLQLHMQADHVSAVGEIRNIELADGSRVQLDSDSAIAVDYARDRRNVKILAGQAFFSVRHDRRRPFSVKADDVDVIVTGTEFEVRLASTAVSVAVADGEVRVSYPQKAAEDSRRDAAVLVAGQGLRVQRPGGVVQRLPVSLQSLASWRRGKLLIESATVGDLVETLRRYRSGAIVITDDTLAAKQVTGVFDLTDPVRALKTMVEPHAGRVREITPWLVIVSGI